MIENGQQYQSIEDERRFQTYRTLSVSNAVPDDRGRIEVVSRNDRTRTTRVIKILPARLENPRLYRLVA
jgi:hypothetical protein